MKKLIGYTLLGLLVVIVLVIGAAAAILATFDPNAYKDEIAEVVQENTGRTLTIEGPISLTYFPVFGFTVEQASLSNPAGFGTSEFASIDELQAGVKLLPLLSESIQFDSIRLVKPNINVIKLANGTTNLDFDLKDNDEDDDDLDDENEAADDMDDLAFSTGEIEISDATVQYTDRGTGKSYTISPMNFSLSSFSFQKASNLSFDAVVKTGGTEIAIDGGTEIAFKSDNSIAQLNDFKTDVKLTNPSLSESVTINASADVVADLNASTAELKDGLVKWDNTSIQTAGTYGWGSSPSKSFNIAADTIDFDKILRVFVSGDKPQAQTAPQPLPVEALRNLSLNGTMSAKTIRAMGMEFTDFQTKIAGQNGRINFDPVSLSLYEGKLAATAFIDATGPTLRTGEKGSIENVKFGGMIEDFLGKEYVSGTASINYDLQGAGNTIQALMSNMGGTAAFDVRDGYINHWQLSKRINQAVSFFENGQINESADDKIRFTTLSGTFTGQNGLFRNNDTTMIGPKVHALGSGDVNLSTKTVDYTVRVGLGDNPESFATADHLPVTMKGPFSSLRYGIDVQSIVMDQAGEKIEEKKQELIGKAFEGLGLTSGAQKQDTKSASDTQADTSSETQADTSNSGSATEPAAGEDTSAGSEAPAGDEASANDNSSETNPMEELINEFSE